MVNESMQEKALWIACMGGKDAKEAKAWLFGYNNRLMGLPIDDDSINEVRGWLEADLEDAANKLEMQIVRFQNQTRYIFDCPGCAARP